MKYIFLFLVSILTIFLLWINIGLHFEKTSYPERKKDIILQLNYLEDGLKQHWMGEKMQQVFPEGYVFINALYGLSWCELAMSDLDKDSRLKKKAIEEVLFAYGEIKSEKANWMFNNGLSPAKGIYYLGWKNYLLSKLLQIDTTFEGHPEYVRAFKAQCDEIVKALSQSETPFLQSYPQQSWPADMFVAMASLSNYDKIFKPRYKQVINTWVNKVKQRLDPVTRLIPHQVDFQTGKSISGSRGCSMSLILRMLKEIDPVFADQQFLLFHKQFIETTMGLPSVREYSKGRNGAGDIDSGPVIFGTGFAATIVMTGTFSVFDSVQLANRQFQTIQAFGFVFTKNDQKRYLFGMLPIADAFIAWGRASGAGQKYIETEQKDYWRLKFHLISAIIMIIMWSCLLLSTMAKKLRK